MKPCEPAPVTDGVVVPASRLEALRRARNKFTGSILEALGSDDEAPPVPASNIEPRPRARRAHRIPQRGGAL